MSTLPRGTVTLLFTDIEGSTELLRSLGRERYAQTLGEHRRILREAFVRHGGVEVDTQGDSFFFVFPYARDAVSSAAEAQRNLNAPAWQHAPVRVRMGLHTGEPEPTEENLYAGLDVHRGSRVMSAAHGGEILLSARTADLVRDEIPDGLQLMQLGSYRLKDFDRPEELSRLVGEGIATEFPPPRAERAAPVRRRALPSPPTALVGRRLEVAAVEAMLRRDDIRLVTLTGPGGTGKTRLALAVAESFAPELREGAVFVDLSAVTEPELVLPAVAQALELEAGEEVSAALAGLSLLLVLDNLEQLGSGVLPVAELLAAAPSLLLLATSRTPLRLSGEHEYPVPPLPAPDPAQDAEALSANDAVRLFTARAQAASPDFAPGEDELRSVARICRRLDGLPLALELAATRVRILTVAEIEQRLGAALGLLVEGARDLPPRQQTLRATLDWSHDLLAEDERVLLARLSVFAGGFRLEDAEAVTGEDATTGLAALVEQGLLRRRTSGGFVLLETIRQYAAEKLGERGEEQTVREQHCDRFLEVAERAWAGIVEGGEAETTAFALLDAEQENLRAAIAWAQQAGEVERVVRFATALRWSWLVQGRFAEGLRVLDYVIAATADDSTAHAQALVAAGILNVRRGDRATATDQLERALALFRDLGDEQEIARCTAELGHVAVEAGDLDRATRLYADAVEQFGRLGNRTRQAVALANLAAIEGRRGESATAAEHGRHAIALQRENGDVAGLGVSLANLGRVDLALGNERAACEALAESLEIAMRIDYRILIAHLLGAAGEVARRRGLGELGARLVGAAVAEFERIGMPIPDEERGEHVTTLAPLRDELGEDAVAALLQAGAAESVDAMLSQAVELVHDGAPA